MKYFHLIVFLFTLTGSSLGQIDSTLLKRTARDSSRQSLNMDAAYQRPFLGIRNLPVSLGGYMEMNWQHLGTDGITEGHQFQFRRVTLFVSSTISRRIKFLSEVEFEDGGKEIAVEFAAIDIEFHPLLNARGGVIVNPIGAFNQNHDGPRWEFTDRPIASTQMLPATWSTPGLGMYGKYYSSGWMGGYELYLSGGFDNSIIQNQENKTFLPAAKENPERFEESASGEPLITAKIAAGLGSVGEIGVSYMGGVYNKYQDDGLVIDEPRRCDVVAIDLRTTIPLLGSSVIGEWAWVSVEVPETYSQQFGSRQQGGFIDIVHPIARGHLLDWPFAVLNLAVRLEYVDWNVGTFRETGEDISDDVWSFMPAVSLRPTPQTVIRLNYRYLRQTDILGNPPARTGGFIFGISSYF